MATRPLRPCTYPGCGLLTRNGRCDKHKREPWAKQKQPPRQRGRALQRERENLFRNNPLCVICEAEGRVTVATIRDHIVPLAEGGVDDDSNVQGICKACHQKKTAEESKRGRRE